MRKTNIEIPQNWARKCSAFSRAFTLIELLVVISIMSLLMGILLPSLSRARQAARKIKCASQMRQTSLALQMWSMDNDDLIFVADFGRVYADGDWFSELLPYICKGKNRDFFKNPEELWICPCDKDPYPVGCGSSPHTTGVTSYALNGIYRQARGTRPEIRLGPAGRFKTLQVRKPSSVMLLMETSCDRFIVDCKHPKAQAFGLSTDMRIHHRRTSGFYHYGSMNVVFVDGHVDSIKGKKSESWSFADNSSGVFWPDLTLPSAAEHPYLWGPGYQK